MEFSIRLGNKDLKVNTDKLVTRASGNCLVQLGGTTVLATAESSEGRPDADFFPLTCSYEEKYYAAGEILGSRFMRREGRPSLEAVIISRLIDRSIRPLFPEGFERETQVIPTCLSWDSENDPAQLAVLASSISLSISDIPWNGPLGAVRVARVDRKFVLAPTYQERDKADLDMIVVGVEENGQIVINMIEMEAKEVAEPAVQEAIDFAKEPIQKLIDFQKEIVKKVGKNKASLDVPEEDKALEKAVKEFLKGKVGPALYQKNKTDRDNALKELEESLLAKVKEQIMPQLMKIDDLEERENKKTEKTKIAQRIFKEEKKRALADSVLGRGERPDGRKLDQIREIETQVSILPVVHGSGLFRRGETKALSVLTLGAPGEHLLIEGMEVAQKKRFFHQYNFPPYSTGEVRMLRSPGRREIGHGMLAEKAVAPVMPDFDDFPYTIRLVTEILSSNGSTSMAAVSAASLALMDGGVPIVRPAAGIAMGLVSRGKDYKVLTDIQGPEDFYGQMDFKIAGTEKGITAMQLDVKIRGLTDEIIREALDKAKDARLKIIAAHKKTIAKPRENIAPSAPKVFSIQIDPDKIGIVIGPGGRVINEITDKFDVLIDIEESGKIFVTAKTVESGKEAVRVINSLVKDVKKGEVYQGTVKKITDFGAFVEILPGKDGLVHISEFTDYRLGKVQDVVRVGDVIPVKVIGVDDEGKISLSAKKAGFKPKSLKREM